MELELGLRELGLWLGLGFGGVGDGIRIGEGWGRVGVRVGFRVRGSWGCSAKMRYPGLRENIKMMPFYFLFSNFILTKQLMSQISNMQPHSIRGPCLQNVLK